MISTIHLDDILLTPTLFPHRYRNKVIDQNWFKKEDRLSVIQKITNIIGDSARSQQFKDHCNTQINQGKVPREYMDFWYVGCRLKESGFNKYWMDHFQKLVESSFEGKERMLMDPSRLTKGQIEQSDSLNDTGNEAWTLDAPLPIAAEDPTKYLPQMESMMSSCFHALFTHVGFDQKKMDTLDEFHLNLTCQPPVNNRDIDVDFMNRMSNEAAEKPGMFEYVVNHPSTATEKDNRWKLSTGHYLLASRKCRAEVQNAQLRERLSSYSHMFRIVTTADFRATRHQGVKIVDDHVATICTYTEMSDLFFILTVRNIYSNRVSSNIFSNSCFFDRENNFMKSYLWMTSMIPGRPWLFSCTFTNFFKPMMSSIWLQSKEG